MGTAGDIEHPALEYEVVGSSYIFFGIVRYFTYTKWRGPGNDKCWERHLKNNERLKVSWMPITTTDGQTWYVAYVEINTISTDSPLDLAFDIPPVHKYNVKILATCNSSDLSMVDGFLCMAVINKFSFFKPEGCTHNTVLRPVLTVPVNVYFKMLFYVLPVRTGKSIKNVDVDIECSVCRSVSIS